MKLLLAPIALAVVLPTAACAGARQPDSVASRSAPCCLESPVVTKAQLAAAVHSRPYFGMFPKRIASVRCTLSGGAWFLCSTQAHYLRSGRLAVVFTLRHGSLPASRWRVILNHRLKVVAVTPTGFNATAAAY